MMMVFDFAYRASQNLSESYDITGAQRPFSSEFDMGAYETNACVQITNRIAYVDSSAIGNNTGSSWVNAFKDLQSAINVARSGCIDTIKIAKGTYKPLNLPSSTAGYNSFNIPDNVVLFGGYPEGGGTRSIETNRSVLFSPFFGTSKHVMMILDKSNVTIDGITVQGGDASGGGVTEVNGKSYPDSDGGGILIYGSNVVIRNTRFLNNLATTFGGGIRAHDSKLTVANSEFSGNNAYAGSGLVSGGAILITEPRIGSKISGSRFENNTAYYNGGAIGVRFASNLLVVDSSVFKNNRCLVSQGSANGGGAVFTDGASVVNIFKSVFDSNSALHGGAILLDGYANTIIRGSVFNKNAAANDGGAIMSRSAAVADITNSLFHKNTAARHGGAIMNNENVRIFYSSFIKNDGAWNGGGIYTDAYTVIANSIFWKNKAMGSETVSGCDVRGPIESYHSAYQVWVNNFWQAADVVGVYPDFFDTTNAIGPDNIWRTADDGFNLNGTSSIVNRGNATYSSGYNDIDIKSEARVQCNVPDMGAYEKQDCSIFTNHTAYVDSAATGNHSGINWQNAYTSIQMALADIPVFNFDTIKIAKGTFYDNMTKDLPSNVIIMGGYPTGGGTRDIRMNPTIIDGMMQMGPMITIYDRSNVTIDGITLQNATLNGPGAAIDARNSQIKILNSTIQKIYYSMGPLSVEGCSGEVVNTVFTDNHYDQWAMTGGVWARAPNLPSFTNCTFYKNYGVDAGAILSYDSTPVIRNCIFWGNNTEYHTKEITVYSNFNQSKISNTYGIYPGFKDTLIPLGADNLYGTADDGLSLIDTAFAINRGVNSYLPPTITTDITGRNRINTGIVDMGAYECDCGVGGGNRLVQLGAVETVNNPDNNCGSFEFSQSQTDPSRFIVRTDAHGNDFNPSVIRVDATTNLNHTQGNSSGDTTKLAFRMISIVAPGSYSVNGGVDVRIYYDPVEFQNLPSNYRSWFKHPAQDKAGVLQDLRSNGLLNATLLVPQATGFENGIAYVEFHNITGFSTFGYLGAITNPIILPVTLLSFKASKDASGKYVKLEWSTTNERDNDRFIIERSVGGQWINLGWVKGQGNSSSIYYYTYTDSIPGEGINNYRLKQVDINGTSKYSPVVSVQFGNKVGLYTVFPNPAKDFIKITLGKSMDVNFSITDLQGRTLIQGRKTYVNGFEIDLSKMNAGMYILKLNGETRKILIQK